MKLHWVCAEVDLSNPDAPLELVIDGCDLWSPEAAKEAFDQWGTEPRDGDLVTVTDSHVDPGWSETRTFIGGQWEFTRMTCKAPPHAAPEAKRDEVQPELLNKRVREW